MGKISGRDIKQQIELDKTDQGYYFKTKIPLKSRPEIFIGSPSLNSQFNEGKIFYTLPFQVAPLLKGFLKTQEKSYAFLVFPFVRFDLRP
jgi:hypothetical protein